MWLPEPDLQRVADYVARFGLTDARPAAQQLLGLRGSPYFLRLDEHGRRRIATLLPRLLRAVAAGTASSVPAGGTAVDTAALLRRRLRIVESIGGRTAYLALLNENPQALERLIEVCRHGDFSPGRSRASPSCSTS